ncbi:MAG TPA: hypothetical protein VD969_02055 [Symbiobacteriaceae bacterium]|nr:hypothetical protein [Symbiobacteriaceae bacterium]
MKIKGYVPYLTAIAMLGAIALFMGWQWYATQEALLESQQKHNAREGGPPFLACSDLGVAELKTAGLSDPLADVIADLETRTDLVPFRPIGGGQTRIGAWLINCNWVLASVGDGHKTILAVLRYEVKDGKINWTVLAAEPDPATAGRP